MVGDDFADTAGGDFGLDAKRGEKRGRRCFRQFRGRWPIANARAARRVRRQWFRGNFRRGVARRLFALVGRGGQTAADWHRLVMGDHQTNTLGEKRGVDGRLGDSSFQRISAAQSSMAAANSSVGISASMAEGLRVESLGLRVQI